MGKPLNISDQARVQMPMKTVASLITMVAIGTWAFFGIQEKLNQHATKLQIMEKDLVENTEFRIKWPRGLLGSLPADSEQYMLIEELYKQMDKVLFDPVTNLIIRDSKDFEVRRFPLAMLAGRAAADLLGQELITIARGNGDSMVKMVSNGL